MHLSPHPFRESYHANTNTNEGFVADRNCGASNHVRIYAAMNARQTSMDSRYKRKYKLRYSILSTVLICLPLNSVYQQLYISSNAHSYTYVKLTLSRCTGLVRWKIESIESGDITSFCLYSLSTERTVHLHSRTLAQSRSSILISPSQRPHIWLSN